MTKYGRLWKLETSTGNGSVSSSALCIVATTAYPRRAGSLARARSSRPARCRELVVVLARILHARTRCRTIWSTARTDAPSESTGASAHAPAGRRRHASRAHHPPRRSAQRRPVPARYAATVRRARTAIGHAGANATVCARELTKVVAEDQTVRDGPQMLFRNREPFGRREVSREDRIQSQIAQEE